MSTLAMGGELARPERLSRAERMELAWVLAWPCLLFGLLYDLFRQAPQSAGAEVRGLDTACGMVSLFLLSPWVVRRTVRLELSGVHLLVVRWGALEGTRAMNYRESLSVAWLICWRTSVVSVFMFLAFSVLLQQRI